MFLLFLLNLIHIGSVFPFLLRSLFRLPLTCGSFDVVPVSDDASSRLVLFVLASRCIADGCDVVFTFALKIKDHIKTSNYRYRSILLENNNILRTSLQGIVFH